MMGGGNMQNLARQAQKLQQQMTKMQEELETREYEASAGGGMVTVKVSGKKELLSIEIKPEAVDPDDVEMLQDLVLAAVNCTDHVKNHEVITWLSCTDHVDIMH